MQFEKPLIEGKLIGRHRKFVADVMLNNGEEISVHCANASGMLSCSEPGSKVLLQPVDNSRIKFDHQLEIVYAGKVPVAVHAGRPMTVLAEAAMTGKVPELAGYATLKRDPMRNRGARIDMVAEGNALRTCYVRVEPVTHVVDGTALYPDCEIYEFQDTMQVFTNLIREGNRVVLALMVQRSDAESLKLDDSADAEFCETFRDGMARGVEIAVYKTKVSKDGLEFDGPLSANFDPPPKTKK